VLVPDRRSLASSPAPVEDKTTVESGLESLLPAVSPDGRLIALGEVDCDLADRCISRVRLFETTHGTESGMKLGVGLVQRWLQRQGFRPMLREQPPWEPSTLDDGPSLARVAAFANSAQEVWLRELGPGRILLRRPVPAPLFLRPPRVGCVGDIGDVSGTWLDPKTGAVLIALEFVTAPDDCPNGHAYIAARLEATAAPIGQ
jgi:hypothetical protein